eukprot:scpid93794/ scgid20667/ 
MSNKAMTKHGEDYTNTGNSSLLPPRDSASTRDSTDENLASRSAAEKLSRLRRAAIVLCMWLAMACAPLNLTAIKPFFFTDALAKHPTGGVSYHTAVGGVFSVSAASVVACAPFVIYDLPNMGSKHMMLLALILQGSATVLFSALNRISDWRVFLVYSYILELV